MVASTTPLGGESAYDHGYQRYYRREPTSAIIGPWGTIRNCTWYASDSKISRFHQSSHSCKVTRMCSACSEHSPQVYTQGWFCTNWSCSEFSMVRFGILRIRQQLTRLAVVSRRQIINANNPYLRGEFLAHRSPSHRLWPRVGTRTSLGYTLYFAFEGLGSI